MPNSEEAVTLTKGVFQYTLRSIVHLIARIYHNWGGVHVGVGLACISCQKPRSLLTYSSRSVASFGSFWNLPPCPYGQESAKLSAGLQIITHNLLERTLSFGTHRRFSPSTKVNALLASLRHWSWGDSKFKFTRWRANVVVLCNNANDDLATNNYS